MAHDRQPSTADHGLNWSAILVAATAMTIGNLFVLTWVTHRGWLAGTAFPMPLGMRLPLYGAFNLGFLVALLAAYQWLLARSKPLALGFYFGGVLVFAIGSIPVLRELIEQGIFVFNGPYSAAWDIAWGVGQFLVALMLCGLFSGMTRSR